MGTVFGLFWRRAWDNIGHVVLLNLIWFTLAIPFFLAFFLASRALFPQVGPVPADTPAREAPNAAASPAASPAAGSTDAALAQPSDAGDAAAAQQAPPRELRLTTACIAPLFMLAMSWLVLCAATGFVYYGTADLVTEYDFSGYRFVIRTFLRRGPILKSIAVPTLFVATLLASRANILFYLSLAQGSGAFFLLLAGVMLWFILFLTMTCVLALAVAAQRDLKAAYAAEAAPFRSDPAGESAPPPSSGLWPSLKTAALISLGFPLQTFFVLVSGLAIMAVGMYSMAGVGFFAVTAPASLFNAYIFVRLGGTVRWTPGQDGTSLYGSAN